MNLILKTLKLVKIISEGNHSLEADPETVKLAPKTLEQLDDAIKEAESQCIVSVVSFAVSEIVEHRLVSSKQSDDVLAELCRKYTLIEDDDVEHIQGEGYYSDNSYHISAIHLDSKGCYDQGAPV